MPTLDTRAGADPAAAHPRRSGRPGHPGPSRAPRARSYPDPGHFRDYHVHNHLPLVTRVPGLLAWRYSFDVAAAQGQTPYFAAEFADAEAMTGARESRQVAADVADSATGGAVVIHCPVPDGT